MGSTKEDVEEVDEVRVSGIFYLLQNSAIPIITRAIILLDFYIARKALEMS